MGQFLAALVVASVVASAPASQPSGKGQAGASPKAKAEQQHATAQLDTTSLEETIREVVKEAGEKHDPHADKHLESEGKLVEYTRQLAVDTKRLAKFTLWLSLVTGLMVAVVAGQLWMFKRQLDLMKGGAKDASDLALAAKDSAGAANLQSAALRASGRAYVGLSRISFFARSRSTPGSESFYRARAEITIINAGRTIATNVKLSLALNVGSAEQVQQQREGETYLLPGVPWNLRHVSKHEISSAQLKLLNSHAERLVLRGKIVYDTIFEKDRISEFAFRHGLKGDGGLAWDGEIFENDNKAS